VIIDVRRAEVRYQGPITPEEKKNWDRMLELRDEQQDEVSFFAKTYRKAKKKGDNPDRLNSLADSWKRSVDLYDRINEPLPERYQKRLENRFYAAMHEAGGETQE
jgi:hypothetical protein